VTSLGYWGELCEKQAQRKPFLPSPNSSTRASWAKGCEQATMFNTHQCTYPPLICLLFSEPICTFGIQCFPWQQVPQFNYALCEKELPLVCFTPTKTELQDAQQNCMGRPKWEDNVERQWKISLSTENWKSALFLLYSDHQYGVS